MSQLKFAGRIVEFDERRIWLTGDKMVLFEADETTEVQKVETNGHDRIFVLVRGKHSQSETNVLALDRLGVVVWTAKLRPTDYDDELVDLRYREPLLETWSWNSVYQFDGRSGELVRKEANK